MATQEEKAQTLASYFIGGYGGVHQLSHRLSLLSFWSIKPGSRILELGCGQGECTVALADAVGPDGHIDAVDPGSPDYGSPYTLSQSQSHISAGPLGSRITWHLQTDPLTYLAALPHTTPKYDYAVLCNCIYYFESPTILTSLLAALIPRTNQLCLAEWSLCASTPSSLPHVIAVLLLAALEAKRRIPAHGNVRTVISPMKIVAEAQSTGWKLTKEEIKKTNEGMQDGYWEVSYVIRRKEKALAELKGEGVNEKDLGALRAMYDSVEQMATMCQGGVEAVKAMDYWAGVFETV